MALLTHYTLKCHMLRDMTAIKIRIRYVSDTINILRIKNMAIT
ncbi:hypothetical protein KOXY103107_10615 [Komagataeibacter xylinus]